MFIYLNEKATKEEYSRRRFNKKYKFIPRQGSKDNGIITVNNIRYPIHISKVKRSDSEANTANPAGNITLDKDVFKLKGSHQNERQDAVLQHEIGHQKLHNIALGTNLVDKRNISPYVIKSQITRVKGFKPTHEERKQLYDANHMKYRAMLFPSGKDIRNRNMSYDAAKAYETNNPHSKAEEFEADRYSANKTSEKAVRNSLRNIIKIKKSKAIKDKNIDEKSIKNSNKIATEDMIQRNKALKDKTLRNSTVYK